MGSGPCCAGLHPWHLAEGRLEADLAALDAALRDARVRAVGECGLDRAVDVPWELQLRAFDAQLARARSAALPVVLHVVKAFPEILRRRRGASTPWLVHGFRGGQELARELWRHGIRLSFGPALQRVPRLQAAFADLPLEAILLESDEAELDMAELYRQASALRSMDPLALAQAVGSNLEDFGLAPVGPDVEASLPGG
jgi:TatD DNase family protein